MVKLQKISKRQPLKQKYSILKKKAAYKKKIKKLLKKTDIKKRRNPRKSLLIPNCLFKKSILENIKRTREIKRNKTTECKEVVISDMNSVNVEEVIKQIKNKPNNEEKKDDTTTKEKQIELMKLTEEINFNTYVNLSKDMKNELFETVKKQYYSKLNEQYKYVDILLDVIKESDVLFYVVDIRNPLFYIHSDIIEFVQSCNKELILVLNKCDLVANEVIKQWCFYFRNYFTTIPFISFKTNTPPYLNKRKRKKKGNYNGTPQNYNNFLITLFKDMPVTLGVIGNVYVGKKSFVKSLTHYVPYAVRLEHKKKNTLPICNNICLYKTCGFILNNDLKGFENIKQIHVLTKTEIAQLLQILLKAINVTDLLYIFKKIKDEATAEKLEEILALTKNSEDNIKINHKKNICIDNFLFANVDKNILMKTNVTTMYEQIFTNQILFYVVPGNKIITPAHNNYDVPFENIVLLYREMDRFVMSHAKKGSDYIAINYDELIEERTDINTLNIIQK